MRPRERCGSMSRSVSSRRGARGGKRRRRATRRACWRSTPSWSRAAVRARSLMPEAVAIQGEAGSFSHAAALETRGPVLRLVPCATFVELFRAVETGAAASGVVPIENTLAGSVHENYDLLSAHALHVVAETAAADAAIASKLAAELYGADVIAEALEDHAENYTRFLVVAREPAPRGPAESQKSSLILSLGNTPGTLYRALGVFAGRSGHCTV